ncbi:Uncharacterised protein [Yersinia enterocolitica]|nr:Uncharacterised protein [Yersinia enterocolitica]
MDIGLSLQARIEADNLINLSRKVSFNNIKDAFFENEI